MYNQFKHFFEQPFSSAHDFLTQIAKPIFGKKNITPHNDTLQNYQTEIENAGLKKVVVVAEITIGGNPIRVYDVTVGSQTNLEHARVGIKRALISFTDVFMHAFVLFHYENSDNREWRFSYFYKQTNNTEVTAARRYTYLVGQGNNCRTIAEQLNNLVTQDKTDKTITDTFGVQALSDDFFRRFTDQYKKFVTEITGTEFKDGVEVAKRDAEPAEYFHSAFEGDSKAVRDFVKKMQGRIVFLHFLQKKGWLGDGKPNYLKSLFDEQPDDIQADFLEQILKPLFFGVLNKKGKKEQGENNDRKKYFTEGKLDEQYNRCTKEHLAKLYIKWEDAPYLNGGLFDPDTLDIKDVKFKTETWQDFFDTLAEYNFTIDENDPDDMEVGVDPEMLGRIFESQLEDNKAKGAFYTPKEIVQYMCAESLIAYLEATLPSIANLAAFVKNPHINAAKIDNKEAILEKLKAVKICDPAIGSGAFPMGMLNLLYNCRRALGDAERNPQGHTIRRQIVENNIYGVDIERGAVDIARLRFWLALIVEETEPEPLPNFDYKFMQGNSLLESFQGVDLSKMFLPPTNGSADFNKELREKVVASKDQFFNQTDHAEKKTLIENIQTPVFELICADLGLVEGMDKYNELHTLIFEANTQFFLWHTWFADVFQNGGFDIVIGNPPYVNVEKIDANIKANIKLFKTAYQKFDLYVLFYEKAIELLKEKGILSFITSNKFMSQDYGLLLRQEFLKNTIQNIVNFNYDIFESATVRTCILQLFKDKSENNYIKLIDVNTQNDKEKFDNRAYSLISQNIFETTDKNNFRINLTTDKINILSKIEENCIRLDEICSANYGLRPSSEILGLKKEAFIHNTNPDNKYKKYFEGKDMGYWLIKNSAFIDYRPDVMYNAMFPELFSNNKLVGLRTLSDIGKLRFIYDNEGFYCNDSVVVLTLWHLLKDVEHVTIKRTISEEKIKTSKAYSYQYLQGILNSKLIKFYVNELLYDGTHFYPNHMKQLPIKIATSSQQRPIISLVESILSAKRANPQADTAALEAEIDALVYELYGLSAEEVKVVEG